MFAFNKKLKQTHLELGTLNYRFTTIGGDSVIFYPKVEGDDVAAVAGRSLINESAKIEANFKEMGYATKLKFVVDGRLEFVGVHMAMADGCPSGGWLPDFARTLQKMGSCVVGSTLNPHTAIASRFQSLAYMACRSCPGMAEGFMSLAREHIELAKKAAESMMVEIDTRHETEMLAPFALVSDHAFYDDKGSVRPRLKAHVAALSDKIETIIGALAVMPVNEQAALLSMSLEATGDRAVTPEEVIEMNDFFRTITIDMQGPDVIGHLPRALRS
jgi:hypothetical protein